MKLLFFKNISENNFKIKSINKKRDKNGQLVICIRGKDSELIIKDASEQNCCEKSILKLISKKFKNLKINGIKIEGYEASDLINRDDDGDDIINKVIITFLTNKENIIIEASNTHNGYYSHEYHVIYNSDLIFEFML